MSKEGISEAMAAGCGSSKKAAPSDSSWTVNGWRLLAVIVVVLACRIYWDVFLRNVRWRYGVGENGYYWAQLYYNRQSAGHERFMCQWVWDHKRGCWYISYTSPGPQAVLESDGLSIHWHCCPKDNPCAHKRLWPLE